mgnify:CR=1 FL=1
MHDVEAAALPTRELLGEALEAGRIGISLSLIQEIPIWAYASIVNAGFREIAERYKADKSAQTTLTAKIRAGGAGSWGPIPMPPQAGSKDDELKSIVGWILAGCGVLVIVLQALQANRSQQLESAKSWKVFHGFQFTDRLDDSGIRFEHRPVDDGARDYKAVHYDHGNGLSVADVDGDAGGEAQAAVEGGHAATLPAMPVARQAAGI